MPDEKRKNLSVLTPIVERTKARYAQDKKQGKTDKSFVQWVSDYLVTNLERDEFFADYTPYISKIGITDNTLFLRDSKANKNVEIRMKNGKLQSNDDDPIYLYFACSLPELSQLKGNK